MRGPSARGHLEIAAGTSSQFVSGLLLAAAAMPLGLDLSNRGDSVPSRAHIDMTLEVLADAGVDVTEPEPEHWIVEPGLPRGLDVVVEPDLSNAAAFLAAALATGGTVTVPGWPAHTTQAGDDFRRIAEAFGAEVDLDRRGLRILGPQRLSPVDLDLSAVGELTPVVAALAALAPGTSHLRGIGHLRGHETDRLAALSAELGALGVEVDERPDALTITGGRRARARGTPTTTIAWSWPGRSSPWPPRTSSSRTSARSRRPCRSSRASGKPCSPPRPEMARIFRDEDYRPRPNRRGSRPRTKHRPSHESAVDGLVTAVDRGRYRVVLADADGDFDADGRTVTAVRASNLRRVAVVPGDIVRIVGDTTGREGTLARLVEITERRTLLASRPPTTRTPPNGSSSPTSTSWASSPPPSTPNRPTASSTGP